MNNKEIGLRIRQAREEMGLAMSDVAAIIKVASSTIKRYEDGEIEKIKIPVIDSIANALNVNPMWIVGKSDRKEIIKGDSTVLNKEARELLEFYNENSDFKLLYNKAKNLTKEDLKTLIIVAERIENRG
jgi:transcriptional regulator with XRE-family HTH domain